MRASTFPIGARHIAPVLRPSLDVATCPTCGRLSRMVFPHLGHLVCVRCYDRIGRPGSSQSSGRGMGR
jgi:hypothetical protein